MDSSTLKSWFSSLSDRDKSIFLVTFMHELTVVIRGVVHENDSESAVRTMYSLSELNHGLTSAVTPTEAAQHFSIAERSVEKPMGAQ